MAVAVPVPSALVDIGSRPMCKRPIVMTGARLKIRQLHVAISCRCSPPYQKTLAVNWLDESVLRASQMPRRVWLDRRPRRRHVVPLIGSSEVFSSEDPNEAVLF